MRRIAALSLFVFLTACSSKPPRFDTIAEEYVFNTLTFSPSAATAAGYHRHNGVPLDELVDEFSPSASDRQRAYYARFASGLKRDVVPEKLSPEDLADYKLVKQLIDLARFDLEDMPAWQHAPQLYAEVIGNALFVPFAQDYAPRNKRFYDILKRLERLPARLLQAQGNLISAPKIWRDVAIEENQGNIELIATIRKERPEELSKKFDLAADEAVKAIQRFNQFLAKELQGKDDEWRLGPEKYQKKFQLTLGTTETPDQLLAAAEAELQKTREEMGRLSGWNGKGDLNATIRKRLDLIAKRHTTRENYFADARRDLEEATAFVQTKSLLPLLPSTNLKLIETPAFMRGIYSVGGFNPAPAMDPQLGAQYWITPIPADWPADRVDSKLREYNFYGLKLLTIHEAMPGHYVQFEYANRVEPRGRRLLRSVYANGAYVEGWAVYATQMMIEEGYLNHDPDLKLTFLKQQLRVISNAILDIKLQTGRMTDQEAITLMTEQAFQEQEEATAKLQRAKLSSVQLVTYYAGWRDHLRMRQVAREAQGSKFNLSAYHKAVLEAGGLPVASVCQLITGRDLLH
ncbi:DUF885 domain-containing protein [Bryobacter aggregatus]|uniref:DUF885 domain-containing protein n=1 Tax=Bryobacter aggregatus TaxID=360054 RepID=UPI0004E10FEC|nr:DUF885 domain-containing protein [Bryobacter aggregatus]